MIDKWYNYLNQKSNVYQKKILLLVIRDFFMFCFVILESLGLGSDFGTKVCILEMHVIYLLQNSSVYLDIHCVL